MDSVQIKKSPFGIIGAVFASGIAFGLWVRKNLEPFEMDFEIPQKELKKRSQKQTLTAGLIIVSLIFIVLAFRFFIHPSVDYQTLQTAQVKKGPITSSLTASGLVVPEFEQIMGSPLQARIDSVYHQAGKLVSAGTPILKLDLSSTQVELEKLEDGLQKKKNEAILIRLRMEKSLADLHSQSDIKKLQINSLESEMEHEKHLVNIGGGRKEDVRRAELNLQVARRELQQLEEQILNQQQTNKADLAALSFDIRIEEKNIHELRRRMQQAEIRAERDGVIVYVKDRIGATVQEGEELVRLADLSRFKVEGKLSESYAPELKAGGKVKVRTGSKDIEGIISAVKPEVVNGLVTFEVSLHNSNAEGLRPNLQVDVYVITAFKKEVLLVRNGAFFKGKKDQKVFVVKGEKAIARSIDIGLTNIDFVEITGLQEGEELILNDMEDYGNAGEIQLENR